MTDTRSALEAALAANPDDAAAHAAYADLLIEQGDPRGEFIRLLLAREGRDHPTDMIGELARAAELLVAYRAAWLGPLHPFVARTTDLHVNWGRGWVDRVKIAKWTRELGAALAACPAAGLLRHLDLSYSRCGDAGVDGLVASGLIARLESLDLGRCGITDDGAAALAGCPDVARLKSLRLEGNHLSPIGAEALRGVGVTDVGPQTFLREPGDDLVRD